jgi:hypothetical protein
MEHWWNVTEKGKPKYSEKKFVVAECVKNATTLSKQDATGKRDMLLVAHNI